MSANGLDQIAREYKRMRPHHSDTEAAMVAIAAAYMLARMVKDEAAVKHFSDRYNELDAKLQTEGRS